MSKRVSLAVVGLGLVATIVAAARLVAVVAASPAAGLAFEIQREIDPSVLVDADNQARAATVSRVVSDQAIFRSLVPPCLTPGAGSAAVATGATCLELVDATLRRDPASGELWLFKTSLEARAGEFGPVMLDALRNSYRTAGSEGWLASGRVILGLRFYVILPDDLRQNVGDDLRLVISNPVLAGPIVRAYATDPSFRAAARPALDKLPPALIEQFVAMVRAAAPAPPG